ncbi:MAG: hypothetical protein QOF02_3630 [Blastocatellia bacterium]|jgi:hypothetical protein|nr:hypothetical protein [Blastocatellia bacterium]
MNERTFRIQTLIRQLTILAVFACVAALPALAQQPKTEPTPAPPQRAEAPAQPSQPAPAIEEKAEKILQRAVAALGGDAYLRVRSSTGRGLFTPFREGVSSIPSSFVDYIIYPDKERTEFRGGGSKTIQTNTGETGWIYDGAAKTIKDMTPLQVTDFKQAMRTNVDNLLRGQWRKEGAKVTYLGRREAGLARRNEAVRVVYPGDFIVDFEFSAQDGLPAKILYTRANAEGEEVSEEDRLAQFVNTNGVSSPFVIDHYTTGIQTSRINYQAIEFNTTIPDTLFARPASVKAIK